MIDLSRDEYVDSLSEEEFNKAVQGYPGTSLRLPHVTIRLNVIQFDYCFKKRPEESLIYEHACAKLNTEQFDYCIKKFPWRAFQYKHIYVRLNSIQLDNCIKIFPDTRICVFAYDKLTPYQKAWIQLK
jgi:hypothetical protein